MAASVILIVSVSCTKFLDRQPADGDAAGCTERTGIPEGQSLGLYYTLRDYAGFSSLPWTDFNSIRSDEAAKGSDANDGKEIKCQNSKPSKYTKDDWATDTYWNDHYTMINLANAEIHAGDLH